MLKVALAVSLLLLALMQTAADAATCDGQKGTVIFEDDFTDDSGGWTHDASAGRDAGFGKSGLTLHIQDPTANWALWNIIFSVSEGDFCVEAVMPKAAAAGVAARSGLLFLANDFNSFYLLMIGSDVPNPSNQQRGAIGLWRKDAGTWGWLGNWSDPKFKLEPGSVVALRAVVKANMIVASVNGIEVKKLRIPLPLANRKFGAYVETDKAVPAPGVTFQFKRYKVTAGE